MTATTQETAEIKQEAVPETISNQGAMTDEMHFGNLGLGNALAVAYDICGDTGDQQHMMYTHVPVSLNQGVVMSEANGIQNCLTDESQQQTLYSHSMVPPNSNSVQPVTQYVIQQNNGPDNHSGVAMTYEAFSYLNPIPTSVSSPAFQLQINNQSGNQSAFSAFSTNQYAQQLQYDSSSPLVSNNQSAAVYNHIINGQSSTSSSCVSPTSNNSLENGSFSSQPPPPPIKAKSAASRSSAANGGSSSSSDDGMYDISEEEIQEIDDSLSQNEEVTKSRHWKYYIETNEWTRATCALMACLFSREQMANSTVLGRGGAQRERLPTNLVAYVVTKIRRRFGKPAAAVRARMAQKCKDERRFGRNPAAQNGQAPGGKTGRGSAVPNGASPSVALKREASDEAAPQAKPNAKRKASSGGHQLQQQSPTQHPQHLNDANNNQHAHLHAHQVQLHNCQLQPQQILYQNPDATTVMLSQSPFYQQSHQTTAGTQFFMPSNAANGAGAASPGHQGLMFVQAGALLSPGVAAQPSGMSPQSLGRLNSPPPSTAQSLQQTAPPNAFVFTSQPQPSSFAGL